MIKTKLNHDTFITILIKINFQWIMSCVWAHHNGLFALKWRWVSPWIKAPHDFWANELVCLPGELVCLPGELVSLLSELVSLLSELVSDKI